jgi:hypothetical protein
MDNYQFAFLLTLAAQIICTIVIIKYQGYLHKKGANTADKEDIAELTKIVETVKAEFTLENGKISSDLDIIKDRRGKNFSQTQQSIINFYNDINNYIFYLSYLYPYQNDILKIDAILSEAERLRYKSEVSINLMELLVQSEGTIKNAYELRIHAFNLDAYVSDFLLTLRADIEFLNNAKHLLSVKSFDSLETKNSLEENITMVEQAIADSQKEHLQGAKKFVEKIRPAQHVFATCAKSYLLIEN